METINEKEQYAEKLAKRAERGLFAIKILFFISVAAAVGLVIYSIVAYTAIDGASEKLIGFVVFIAVIAALLTGVVVCVIVSKVSLNKLKKLG